MGVRRFLVGIVASVAAAAPGVVVVASSPAVAASPPVLTVGDATTWEGDSGGVRYVSFPVTLSDPVASTTTLSYHLMSGSASAPADFADLGGATKTLSFSPGTSQSKFVTVKVVPDTVDEADETFTLMVLGVTGGAVTGTTTATGTILDDDPGSGVRLAVSDVKIAEGDTGKTHVAKFWVSLSQPATSTVTVHAMTMNVSATGGSDYTAKMVNLSFRPGQVRKPVSIVVKPDTNPEADEQFHVMLSNGVNAVIADDTGEGTIVTDDAAGLTTSTHRIGPFNLAAYGQNGWQNEGSGVAPRPSGNFAIKGMRFDIVDANGVPVDMHDVHLHHVVMLDASRSDAVCPSWPNRFAGAGKERTALALGDSYAYRVNGTDPAWAATWHVMNMSAQARTVYIEYEIDSVASTSTAAARPVTSYWLDVTGPCTNSEYNVPGNGGAGSVHVANRTYTQPRAGTRVFTAGHLHDGGIDNVLKRTASGQTVCTNTAMYMMPGMLHEISPCTNATSVAAGEQFTTSARYDNSAPVAGAMGIQISYVWEP